MRVARQPLQVLVRHRRCNHACMIEQPPEPDVPQPPDALKPPRPVHTPVGPGETGEPTGPDIHPVPPPTDPAPPAI